MRPIEGFTPRIEKNSADTIFPLICSGSPVPVKLKLSGRYAAIDESEWLSRFQSRKLGYEIEPSVKFGLLSNTTTNLSAAGKGKELRSTPFTMEKTAVFAPIPSASVSSATAVNARFFRNMRIAERR